MHLFEHHTPATFTGDESDTLGAAAFTAAVNGPHPLVNEITQLNAALATAHEANAELRERVGHLETALVNSRSIGTAIGILMTQRRITSEQAFALLRTLSQHSQRKLHAIAAQVVYTGELPPDPAATPRRST